MNCRKNILILLMVVIVIFAHQKVKADFAFGPAENLGPNINSSLRDSSPTIIPDNLTLWFSRRANINDTAIWWKVTRETPDDPWGIPIEHGSWSDSDWNIIDIHQSYTTPDGLELYLSYNDLAGGYGSLDIWVMKRESRSHQWGLPTNLGSVVNTEYDEMWPSLSPDGLELYFSGFSSGLARPGGFGHSDLWVTKRESIGEPWGEPVNLGHDINSIAQDARPNISADGLVLFFDSYRVGGQGAADLYMTRRRTIYDPWGKAENLGPLVNSPAWDSPVDLSDDCRTLYFASPRPGGYGDYDIWQSAVIPLADLNCDGEIDGKDVLRMAHYWGTDDQICDIGPMPWGDGIVDVQDVAVLAEFIGKDVNDPTLIAHWPLDETEGTTTREVVSGNDSFVLGEPVWEPDGGAVDGALLLDGIDDFISTLAVLNPEDGPFSVLLWAKGGDAGQAIISETTGKRWLSLDPLTGSLMTALTQAGRLGGPLLSQTAISDGNWHRIGFVWDGSTRALYVDGIAVAQDTQGNLVSSVSGLYIGCGNPTQPSTFFSGLIDDVRIYNRAVKP